MTAIRLARVAPRIGPANLLNGLAIGGTGAIAGLLLESHTGGLRLALAGAAATLLVGTVIQAPKRALVGLVVWLAVLGLLRRLVSEISPTSPLGDPLLLVAALTWVALGLSAIQRGALRQRTPLTTAVLVLGALMALSGANPLQGGPAVGFAGILLVVIPMLAFLVGRSLVDDEDMRRFLWVLAGLALVSAGYGLTQTFRGMPSWDQHWVTESGYEALSVGGTIRAFASFSAASEYATFLGVGTIAILALGLRARRLPLALPAIGLLGLAIWYESSRGIIVLSIAAAGLVLTAWRGQGLIRSLLLGVALIAAIPWGVDKLAPELFGTDPRSRLVAHQVHGLSAPLGERSTLPVHVAMLRNGLNEGFRRPIGRGVGAVTIAARKYGGSPLETEVDPSNVAVAAGLPGLAMYLVVVVLGFRAAHRLAVARRDPAALAALGILAVTFLSWLIGGQYAVVFLPWLLLGWIDRHVPRAGREDETSRATA